MDKGGVDFPANQQYFPSKQADAKMITFQLCFHIKSSSSLITNLYIITKLPLFFCSPVKYFCRNLSFSSALLYRIRLNPKSQQPAIPLEKIYEH